MVKIEIFPFSIGHSSTTLQVKKFAQNRSISYGFRDIHTFSFSAKIQDGRQKWEKIVNLISKLHFYKLIPYPMDKCYSGRRRPARQTSDR